MIETRRSCEAEGITPVSFVICISNLSAAALACHQKVDPIKPAYIPNVQGTMYVRTTLYHGGESNASNLRIETAKQSLCGRTTGTLFVFLES